VERPAINRDEGATLAFSKARERKALNAPPEDTIAGLRDRAILSAAPHAGASTPGTGRGRSLLRHQADHKGVIARERFMRETERAAASTIRRCLAGLSSLYKHLIRHAHVPRHSVGEVA